LRTNQALATNSNSNPIASSEMHPRKKRRSRFIDRSQKKAGRSRSTNRATKLALVNLAPDHPDKEWPISRFRDSTDPIKRPRSKGPDQISSPRVYPKESVRSPTGRTLGDQSFFTNAAGKPGAV
jgi:hypothetical protein